MSIDRPEGARPLLDRPNLRHLKDQAKDLLAAGAAESITDAQFKIARLYGFASWPRLKAHIDSLAEVGQLKQAIDTNDLGRVKAMMTRDAALPITQLLLDRGADLTVRAKLPGDYEQPDEIVECTALGYALRFGTPGPRRTVTLLRERGGVE